MRKKTVLDSWGEDSFLSIVEGTVEGKRDQLFGFWYDAQGTCTKSYRYGDLWDEAGVVAHYLTHEWGVKQGQCVMLCYNFGLHFLASFLGCLRAGVVAVLVYPPAKPLTKSLTKMDKVLQSCKPVLILTDSHVNMLRKLDSKNPLSKSRSMWPDASFKFIPTDTLKKPKAIQSMAVELYPSDLAFLQYTSGSTGDPKGVMITFNNIKVNVGSAIESFYRDDDTKRGTDLVGCSWLPQYHDFGLIIGMLTPFVAGWTMHYTSPISFIQNPLLWFELISKNKVHWTAAPDFAYHLVSRKFEQAKHLGSRKDVPDLDLSSLKIALNGAEPIRSHTKDTVDNTFAPFGLGSNWHTPVYGMAEHVVYISDLHDLCKSHVTNPGLVAVARRSSLPVGFVIKIVDPDSCRELADGQVGEIWLSSPCVAAGYYGLPDRTAETFEGRIACDSSDREASEATYLRSGDLGFFENDYLFVCGRQKDLIICNGVNYYPQDIEDSVQASSPAVRPGCVAAFSSDDSAEDGNLEIVFEIRKEHESEAAEVCSLIQAKVAAEIGLSPHTVVAIPARNISKTTSGKIQRRATRELLRSGKLVIVWKLSLEAKRLSTNLRSISFCARYSSEAFSHQQERLSYSQIMEAFLGVGYDPTHTWDDLGVTSIAAVEIKNQIAEHLSVMLPPDCFELYPTPAQLDGHIKAQQGKPFPTKNEPLLKDSSIRLSKPALVCAHLVGFCMHMLVFTVGIIPAAHVGKAAASASMNAFVGDRMLHWLWLPIAVPVFMVAFSVAVILSKWVVIGRYQECEYRTSSLGFLCWWWMDRLMHIWEFWCGRLITDTPLIWLVYVLMGAKIHPSACIDGFLREFDLIKIGPRSSVEQDIRCRKFSPWREKHSSAGMRLRNISVGSDSFIKGMLFPGVVIGNEVLVEKQSVVEEGAHVASNTIAKGNIAFNAGHITLKKTMDTWVVMGAMKVVWLGVELYLFFGSLFVAQIIWNERLPKEWRYTPLMMWFLLIGTGNLVSILGSIILKWILVGRRTPGRARTGILPELRDWVVDLHFRLSIMVVYAVVGYSRFWNVVLMALGADVDFASKVDVDAVSPSQADLVHIRRSFLSTVGLNPKNHGEFGPIEIVGSSLGLAVQVHGGTRIVNSVVPPMSTVDQDIVAPEPLKNRSSHYGPRQTITLELWNVIFIGILWVTLIPGYEVWRGLDPKGMEMSVPVLIVALIVTTITWFITLRLILPASHSGSLHAIAINISYSIRSWSLWPLLWGTKASLVGLRFLGCSVGKDVLYLGNNVHDPHLVTFADRSVVDETLIIGHHVVYKELTLGPACVSGVSHPGNIFAVYNGPLQEESGPWRAYVGGGGEEKPEALQDHSASTGEDAV